jgi:hypothetical protein
VAAVEGASFDSTSTAAKGLIFASKQLKEKNQPKRGRKSRFTRSNRQPQPVYGEFARGTNLQLGNVAFPFYFSFPPLKGESNGHLFDHLLGAESLGPGGRNTGEVVTSIIGAASQCEVKMERNQSRQETSRRSEIRLIFTKIDKWPQMGKSLGFPFGLTRPATSQRRMPDILC